MNVCVINQFKAKRQWFLKILRKIIAFAIVYSNKMLQGMKSYWLMIVEKDTLCLSSRYYKIPIGRSKQDTRDWEYLKQYACSNGFFFEKWDNILVEYILKVAKSLNCSLLDLQIQGITARELVRYIMQNGDTPKKSSLLPSFQKIRNVLRPSSYFNRQINVIRHAEAKQRKKPKAQRDTPQK